MSTLAQFSNDPKPLDARQQGPDALFPRHSAQLLTQGRGHYGPPRPRRAARLPGVAWSRRGTPRAAKVIPDWLLYYDVRKWAILVEEDAGGKELLFNEKQAAITRGKSPTKTPTWARFGGKCPFTAF